MISILDCSCLSILARPQESLVVPKRRSYTTDLISLTTYPHPYTVVSKPFRKQTCGIGVLFSLPRRFLTCIFSSRHGTMMTLPENQQFRLTENRNSFLNLPEKNKNIPGGNAQIGHTTSMLLLRIRLLCA